MTKYTSTCNHCSNIFTFSKNQSNGKYCNKLCWREGVRSTATPNSCLQCNKLTFSKFCDSSCSATYNNTLRGPKTLDSKIKTSQTVSGGICKLHWPTCRKCNLQFPSRYPKTIYCSNTCSTKIITIREKHPKFTKVYTGYCIQCNSAFLHKSKRTTCSDECWLLQRTRNNRSNLHYVQDSYGNDVCLGSSWELKVSKYLNSKNIIWIRPAYIAYIMDNKQRKYFPDFYLPEYNIYLDPKNDLRIREDQPKLDIICSMITLYYGSVSSIISRMEESVGFEPTDHT